MFSKQDALNAYQDYAYRDMRYEAESRIGRRSIPLVGGVIPVLKRIGNGLSSLVMVPGAFVFGYGNANPVPDMPELPPEFKGSDLEKAFHASWDLNKEVVKTRIQGFEKLLALDIGGWWKKASVASHADAKDATVIFPEELLEQQAAQSSHFADMVRVGMSAGVGRG